MVPGGQEAPRESTERTDRGDSWLSTEEAG
jgi:hypothetical protein